MEDIAAHARKLADRRAGGLVRPRSVRWIRCALAVKAALVVALIAAAHEQPSVMLVGLAPLALVAAEAAWHLLDPWEDERRP